MNRLSLSAAALFGGAAGLQLQPKDVDFFAIGPDSKLQKMGNERAPSPPKPRSAKRASSRSTNGGKYAADTGPKQRKSGLPARLPSMPGMSGMVAGMNLASVRQPLAPLKNLAAEELRPETVGFEIVEDQPATAAPNAEKNALKSKFPGKKGAWKAIKAQSLGAKGPAPQELPPLTSAPQELPPLKKEPFGKRMAKERKKNQLLGAMKNNHGATGASTR